jgi:hypothetical protein
MNTNASHSHNISENMNDTLPFDHVKFIDLFIDYNFTA